MRAAAGLLVCGLDLAAFDAGAAIAITHRAVAAEPAVSSYRAALFGKPTGFQSSGDGNPAVAERLDRIAFRAAERHQSAGASLVRASIKRGPERTISLVRAVQRRFPPGALELSI